MYQISKIFPQNAINWPKYVRKIYFIRFYSRGLGDLVTCMGEWKIQSVSRRVGIEACTCMYVCELALFLTTLRVL